MEKRQHSCSGGTDVIILGGYVDKKMNAVDAMSSQDIEGIQLMAGWYLQGCHGENEEKRDQRVLGWSNE